MSIAYALLFCVGEALALAVERVVGVPLWSGVLAGFFFRVLEPRHDWWWGTSVALLCGSIYHLPFWLSGCCVLVWWSSARVFHGYRSRRLAAWVLPVLVAGGLFLWQHRSWYDGNDGWWAWHVLGVFVVVQMWGKVRRLRQVTGEHATHL